MHKHWVKEHLVRTLEFPVMTNLADPVFVGGTGRSGTTILAQLIGQHSAYALIPIEARFHCEESGLPGVHAGTVSPEQFRELFLDRYFFRKLKNGTSRGLRVAGVPRRRAVRAIDEFVESYAQAPSTASAALMNRLFMPLARESGAKSWVEMTPPNAEHSDFLQTLFPRARMLHIVRDGRDVAVSVAARRWGPDDPFEALDWWADRLRAANAATGDPRRVLLVNFDALMVADRKREYRRIQRFLGLSDEPAMRRFFEDELTLDRAHRGRWREAVAPSEHERFNAAYERILGELREEDVQSVGVLDQGDGKRRLLRRALRTVNN